MKIELKRISVNERMSDETTMFIADLYIDGKKVGFCQNNGCGGSTYYHGSSIENNELIRKCEEYCKTLPKVKFRDMEWEQSLEGVIDELVEKHLEQKDEKKRQKMMEKSIMFGVPNGYSYRRISWGKKLLSEIPHIVLQQTVDKIRHEHCKDGVVILNTNLRRLGII
jgi:hypothetical protein